MRILLADDDELVLESIKTALELRGFHVTEASDGEEALEKFAEGRPWDLVILDLVMPERDGESVLQEIKRNNPTAKVMIISGAGKTRSYRFLKTFPDVEFLPKPFTTPRLLSAVDRFRY